MTEELKPCPFCGTYGPIFLTDRNMTKKPPTFMAHFGCLNCKCFFKMEYRNEEDRDGVKEELKKQWNRRASE